MSTRGEARHGLWDMLGEEEDGNDTVHIHFWHLEVSHIPSLFAFMLFFFCSMLYFSSTWKKNKTHMTSHPSDPLRWTYCTCKAAVLSQQTSAQTSCVRDQTLSLYPINGSKFLHWAIYFQKQWQSWKDSPCFEDLHQLVCLLFDLYSENAEDNNRLFLFPFFLDLYQCNQSSSS